MDLPAAKAQMDDQTTTSAGATRLPADFVQIPREIFEDLKAGRLNEVDIVTYGLLAGHAIKTDSCFPLQGTLAEIAGWSVSKVQRSLRNLIKAGRIKSTSRGMNRARLITLLTKARPAMTARNGAISGASVKRAEPMTVKDWLFGQK
jgi:hypothetical protein